MKFVKRKEAFDRLVERAGLECIEEADRILAASVLDAVGLDIHIGNAVNVFREDGELARIEKTLKETVELDEKGGEKIALSLVRYLHSEIIRGVRQLKLECFDANYFAGVFDRKLFEGLGRYAQSFRNKSIKHFQGATGIWEDIEEYHRHIFYRVGRAAHAYSNLFRLTGEHKYADTAYGYIPDLEMAIRSQRVPRRDRNFIIKVLEHIYH